jgi:hypothetical protein
MVTVRGGGGGGQCFRFVTVSVTVAVSVTVCSVKLAFGELPSEHQSMRTFLMNFFSVTVAVSVTVNFFLMTVGTTLVTVSVSKILCRNQLLRE